MEVFDRAQLFCSKFKNAFQMMWEGDQYSHDAKPRKPTLSNSKCYNIQVFDVPFQPIEFTHGLTPDGALSVRQGTVSAHLQASHWRSGGSLFQKCDSSFHVVFGVKRQMHAAYSKYNVRSVPRPIIRPCSSLRANCMY